VLITEMIHNPSRKVGVRGRVYELTATETREFPLT
jgi:hypothetical protein